ncbi:MAG: hypothetical protein WCH44_04865, partial [Betaproteobacteria bacterium]
LYVLNAVSGALIKTIGTGAGDSTTPSGLRELTSYVSNAQQDNSALRVYGGDLLGNLWRFDINGSATQAVLITTLKDTATPSAPQPITTRLNLAEVDGNTFLLVGTGEMLGTSDIDPSNPKASQVQTVYSIKDPLTTPKKLTSPLIDPESLRSTLRPIVLTTTVPKTNPDGSPDLTSLVRTAICPAASGGAVNPACANTDGWYVDLTQPNERVTIDMAIAAQTLVFHSNVPSNSACSAGSSLLNYLNFQTGDPFAGPGGHVSQFGADSLATGATPTTLPAGAMCEIVQIVTNADGTNKFECIPTSTPPPLGKRISWREIAK